MIRLNFDANSQAAGNFINKAFELESCEIISLYTKYVYIINCMQNPEIVNSYTFLDTPLLLVRCNIAWSNKEASWANNFACELNMPQKKEVI